MTMRPGKACHLCHTRGRFHKKIITVLESRVDMSNLTDVSRSIKLDPKIEHFRTQTLFLHQVAKWHHEHFTT